jgi:MscS family membrane protein
VWVDFHQIKEEILLKILNIIHANGADVAFPTQTLQLEQIAQIEQTPPEASF